MKRSGWKHCVYWLKLNNSYQSAALYSSNGIKTITHFSYDCVSKAESVGFPLHFAKRGERTYKPLDFKIFTIIFLPAPLL